MHPDFAGKIDALRGPILVLGASGFLGANLLRLLLEVRSDAYGTARTLPAWRLEGIPAKHLVGGDLLLPRNLRTLLHQVQPGTVFDCLTCGGHSFQGDPARIYETNVSLKVRLAEMIREMKVHGYVHAGSSTKYGSDAGHPLGDDPLQPESHYAVSMAATAGLLHYLGKHLSLRCADLRFSHIYGPLEERSGLVASLVVEGLRGACPTLPDPQACCDFLFVEDACEAFVDTALHLTPDSYGESFHIGSGSDTSMQELAALAQRTLALPNAPGFSSAPTSDRPLRGCSADPGRAKGCLGWSARTPLAEGFLRTVQWYSSLPHKTFSDQRVEGNRGSPDESISAIVCCYKDGQAIPIMVERLVQVFDKLRMDYEIILVNNGSPDNSEEIIQEISGRNPRVLGVTLSRNFGAQAAYRSGLELASKRACVLLDGDLQDPPELIAEFVDKWRQGYEVVYGRRVKREASLFMQVAYKLFYVLFNRLAYVYMPRDAGDFSLMDRRAVRWVLACNERDLFIRGLRAFVGFRQIGVNYVRPERMFGRSTNNFFKNIGWAMKGILSFSNIPLTMLTSAGVVLVASSFLLGLFSVLAKLLYPQSAPRGITTIVLLVLGLGSLNLLAISIVGEYIARIFEEVKGRPHYICMNIIQNGEIHQAPVQRDE